MTWFSPFTRQNLSASFEMTFVVSEFLAQQNGIPLVCRMGRGLDSKVEAKSVASLLLRTELWCSAESLKPNADLEPATKTFVYQVADSRNSLQLYSGIGA